MTMLTSRQKKFFKLISVLFVALGLAAAVALVRSNQDIRSKAKTPSPSKKLQTFGKRQPKRIYWKEETIDATVKNTPINAARVPFSPSNPASLPVTGYWEGKTVKVVPNDRFPPEFYEITSEGVHSIQYMPDGRIFFGNYDIFGIKEKDDAEWERLTFYQLKLDDPTWITFFTPTLQTPYEVYFGDDYTSAGRVVRMKTDGTFELVTDSTDLYGYLRAVRLTPYKANHGVFAYRGNILESSLYYIEQGTVRKWLLPTQSCGNGVWSDIIESMFTDPYDTHEVYAFVSEANCGVYTTYLYHYDFDGGELVTTKLGKINGGAGSFKKTFVSKRLDDNPEQKMVYGGAGAEGNSYYLMTIPYLYTDGTDMESQWFMIPEEDEYPFLYNSTVQIKPEDKTDHVWFVATEVLGIYLGRNFDNKEEEYFIRTEDNTILANPWMNDVTYDPDLNVYTGHNYDSTQFNRAMVTILEGSVLKATPTPTPIPSPTPTPTPTPPPPNPLFGNAIKLKTDPEGHISTTYTEDINIKDDFTIEAWININDMSDVRMLFGQESVGDLGPVYIYPSTSLTGEKRMYAQIIDDAEEYYFLGTSSIVELNKWYHIALVKQGAAVKLYLDGQLEAEEQLHNVRLKDYAYNFFTGYLLLDGSVFQFDGQVDELRVSGVTRYLSDFTPPYHPHEADADTLLLYHFDEINGVVVIDDDSGRNHQGTVVGEVEFVESTIPFVEPTPSPTPPPNRPPKIISATLKDGVVGERYNDSLWGGDQDSTDTLTMTVTHLPDGIRQGPCRQMDRRNHAAIQCVIYGTPAKTGSYGVRVKLTDSAGNSDFKTLKLTIAAER